MIEAFEIGVSLAFQDGVLDSVSLAQRNLAALERAVSSSGVAIQTLRDAGSRAASVPVTMRQNQPSIPKVRQGANDTRSIEAVEPEVSNQSLPQVKAAKNEMLDTNEVFPAAPPSSAAIPNQPHAGAPVLVGESQAPSSTPNDGGARLERDPSSFGNFIKPGIDFISELPVSRGAVSDGGVVAPAAGLAVLPQGFPYVELPENSPQQVGLSNAGYSQGHSAPQTLDLVRFSQSIENTWLAGQGAAATANTEDIEVLGEQSGGEPVDRSVLETSLLPHYITGQGHQNVFQTFPREDYAIETDRGVANFSTGNFNSVDKPDTEGQQKSAAPQAQRQEPQDLAGDVYLDGILLGRWISRFLQKQAERADAGPTGFDAKRGRLLPGVTVGG